MKVYRVYWSIPYEGEQTVDLYSSEEAALARAKKENSNMLQYPPPQRRPDEYFVEEHDVVEE